MYCNGQTIHYTSACITTVLQFLVAINWCIPLVLLFPIRLATSTAGHISGKNIYLNVITVTLYYEFSAIIWLYIELYRKVNGITSVKIYWCFNNYNNYNSCFLSEILLPT